MNPAYTDDSVTVYLGDCLDVLPELADASIDAVITDPPYEISFMSRHWDASGIAYSIDVWKQCLRVLKPGGHLLAFGGTRTWHRLACAIEDAGFEMRDSIAWLCWVYGSGFPKSLDVSKAIDKRGGNAHLAAEIAEAIKAARESRGWTTGQADRHFCGGSTNWTWYEGRKGECRPPTPNDFARIAAEWPELAPLAEMVAQADREVVGVKQAAPGVAFTSVGPTELDITAPATDNAKQWQGWGTALKPAHEPITLARKPLQGTVAQNVLTHGTGALNIDASRIESGPRPAITNIRDGRTNFVDFGKGSRSDGVTSTGRWPANVILDEQAATQLDQQSGTARSSGSRFFYTPKAGPDERPTHNDTTHPTVKPVELIRWLVRLVTPPHGLILDPFAGTGTTGEAAILEHCNAILIEREPDYLPLITTRLRRPIQLGFDWETTP